MGDEGQERPSLVAAQRHCAPVAMADDTSAELFDTAASMKGSGWGRRELSFSSD